MPDAILALNAGPELLKFALYQTGRNPPLRLVCKGELSRLDSVPHLAAVDAACIPLTGEDWPAGGLGMVLGRLLDWIDGQLDGRTLAAIGHLVAHGGPDHDRPIRTSLPVMVALERLVPHAPEQQRFGLGVIRGAINARPGLAHYACIDTAFHRTIPAVAALPRARMNRYRSHGLSFEFVARAMRQVAPNLVAGRVVVAHLGGGASLCAMQDGISVDKSIDFTALDGPGMDTLHAGVALYVRPGLSTQHRDDVLYRRTGLAGGARVPLAGDDAEARVAIELFVFRIAQAAAALASSLGGLDGFVFTGAIGRYAPDIRGLVCERLRWMGVALDPVANVAQRGVISAPGSAVEVRMIATDEEAMVALQTMEGLARTGQQVDSLPGRALPPWPVPVPVGAAPYL